MHTDWKNCVCDWYVSCTLLSEVIPLPELICSFQLTWRCQTKLLWWTSTGRQSLVSSVEN